MSEVIKAELNYKNIKNNLDFLKYSGVPYELHVSTYTTKIRSEILDIDFIKNQHSLKMFSAYAKIKKDILEQEAAGRKIDKVDRSNIYYYRANILEDIQAEKVHHIDLNSAYLQTLYNYGWISPETFEYCNKLSKPDRLASLGMLASNKDIFYYNSDGNIEAFEEIKNPLSDYFFFCSLKVGEILRDISSLIGSQFLFFWVDGFYFKDFNFISEDNINMSDEYKNFTPEYLTNLINNNYHYKSSYEIFTDFKATKNENIININYKVSNIKSKNYQIPIITDEYLLKKELLKLIKLD